MSTNYIAPIWRMPRNANNTPVDKLSDYSMEFDAGTSSQAIDCGNSDTVNITGPISISVWFNANNLSASRGIVCKNNNVAQQTQAQYFFDILNGDLRWRAGRSTVTYNNVQADQWYHAVGVYDGSNTTLYIDGVQVATTAASASSYQSTEPMYIGRRLGQSYFGGRIAQVCIFDYALTDGTGGTTDQISYLYNLNNPMVPGPVNLTTPVAYWPLGDNSNANANDGYPNISVGSDSVFNFNGSSNWINVPDNDLLSFGGASDSPFSMSAWIKTTAFGDGIISRWGNGSGSGSTVVGYEYILYVQRTSSTASTARLRLALYDQGTATPTTGNVQRRDSVTIINTGEWVHVVATYDGRGGNGTNTNTANLGITMYINGVPESSYIDQSGGSYSHMRNSNRPTEIGVYNDTSSVAFNGEMTNAQVWNEELTAEQALELYNNGQPLMTGTQPQESNLIAWWKLNQTANWAADSVTNWQIPDSTSAYPQSFKFNESQDYIQGNLNLDGEKVHAVSFWAKNKQSSGLGYILSCRPSSYGPGFSFIVRQSDTTGYIFSNVRDTPTTTQSNASGYQSSLGIPQDNSWHHVLFTHSIATGQLKAYIDGVYKYQRLPQSRNDTATINPLKIGSNQSVQDFGGNVSNVMVWEDVVLTDGNIALGDVALGEIAEVYNNGVPITSASVQPDKLKVWYKLDNTATFSTNWSIPDASGNGNTGTSTGMTEQNLVNNNVSVLNGESTGMNTTNLIQSNLTRTQPFSNYSMFYDAVDVYSTFDTQISLGSSDSFTWSFWIKPVYNSITDMVLLRASATSITANNTMLLSYSGGNWRIKWDNASGNFTTGYVMPNNEWSHVALSITQGTGTRYAYINGVQDSANPAVAGITSQWLGFSSQNNTNDFEGYLSQCAYWDTNLSTTELAALYNNGVPQDLRQFSIQPTQYWPMNEEYSYWNGSVWVNREIISNNNSTAVNTAVVNALVGNAPGSEGSGVGSNLAISDLKGNMYSSDKNAYSINMADYGDPNGQGVPPASSGRNTDVP